MILEEQIRDNISNNVYGDTYSNVWSTVWGSTRGKVWFNVGFDIQDAAWRKISINTRTNVKDNISTFIKRFAEKY
jgi:hypothetical protein